MELNQGCRPTEIGLIPSDWDVSAIGSVAEFSGGSQPPRSVFKYSESDEYIRLIQIRDYKSDDFLTYIPRHLARKFCSADDIMIGRYGPPIFQILRGIEGAYNVALIKTTPNEKILKNYLYLVLKQEKLFNLIEAMSRRTSGQTGVEMPALKGYLFPLPPKHEQHAIAETIYDVDALIAGLEKLIAKKRDLKQAAMQQLLTGQTRLPGFSGEWAVKRLGDVGECLRGVSYKGDADLFPHDTDRSKRLLRSNNVQESLVVTSDLQYVKVDRVHEHQVLREGDILICMANGSKALVGKAGYFEINDGFEYTFGAFMGAYRGNEQANRRFVFYLFQTNRYRDYITNLLAGSSINNLSPSSIESLEFNFPELDEQDAIAQALRDMDGELASLESRLAKTHTIKQGMMQELLTGKMRLV